MLVNQKSTFDHLLHLVPDVATAVAAYTAAGIPAHANPPLTPGYHNGAWSLDDRYVEILNITDPERFAASPFGQAFPLLASSYTRVRAVGGGALTFAIRVDDAALAALQLRAFGHDVLEVPIQVDGVPVSFTEVFLRSGPRWRPFFITYSDHKKLMALIAKRINRGAFNLRAVVIETPDPAAQAAWLGTLIGLEPVGNSVPLPGAEIRFEAGPADTITEILLSGPRAFDQRLDGLRYRRAG